MASTKEYRDFVIDSIGLENITYKPMMGEYLFYYDGLLFGGVYDDRFLVKKVDNNIKYNLEESIPYDGAKPMYLVDIGDKELIKDIIIDTCNGLKKR